MPRSVSVAGSGTVDGSLNETFASDWNSVYDVLTPFTKPRLPVAEEPFVSPLHNPKLLPAPTTLLLVTALLLKQEEGLACPKFRFCSEVAKTNDVSVGKFGK